MAKRASAPPAASVGWDRVLALRLDRQRLAARAAADRLVDVVGELVGVHAQVMSSAELHIAARVDGVRATDVRDVLWEQRRLVKAWSFRGTLHLLTPDDLADFVAAARTRERWHEPVWLRAYDLKVEDMEAIIAAVDAVLSDRPMTRADLADAVARECRRPELGDMLRTGWGTFLGAPAQRGHLIFGPNDGRNVTFVKPSAWLGRPIAPSERGDAPEPLDAMASMISRFLHAFPGSSRDMIGRWWGAVRGGLVRDALARLPVEVAEIEADGVPALVRSEDVAVVAATQPFVGVRLLPGFDPFTNELPRRVESILPVANHDLVYRIAGWVTPLVLIDGRIAGTWEIRSGKKAVVDVVPWSRWRGRARTELEAEVDRFAAFLDKPLGVEYASSLT
ncbi:MAG TPA: winged helix DNA-binding domain-containing protein [Candidatus Limnocylindrales bacterium]|nr:winged helix DNA-binding domain-containing protein [Candidatus Limnocylindrales bacterium]